MELRTSMDNPDSTTSAPPTTEQAWLRALSRKHAAAAYALFALALVFIIGSVWLAYRYHWDYAVVWLWGGVMTMIAIGIGAWLLATEPGAEPNLDMTRLQVLTLGGLAGLATALLLGPGLGYIWWETIKGGWSAWQGPKGWQVWVTILAVSGGFALMLLSLQLARADERSNALLRRLLYGYNAVLTGLLLFGILFGVNALAYTKVPPFEALNQNYRWATMSIYSLSEKSEKILESLKKPTKIYVILPQGELYFMMRGFLDNCRSINPKIEVEYLSPNNDAERVRSLDKEYKFNEPSGVLLLYGDDHRFIKPADLTGSPDFSEPDKATRFKGEGALMAELSFLLEGKEKPVIYFTQGSGELELADARSEQPDRGLGMLKQRLEGSNYTVKGLQFSPVQTGPGRDPNMVSAKEVPKDATLVVIARPTRQLPDLGLKALRDYMDGKGASQKKGALVVFLDVESTGNNQMAQTGLETLLAEYGVSVGNNRLLTLPQRRGLSPLHVLGTAPKTINERNAHPLVTSFARTAFVLYQTRVVEPQKNREPGRYNVEVLLEVSNENQHFWAETDLDKDPLQLIVDLDRADQLGKKVSKEPRSIAVAVSEQEGGGGPHAFMNPEKKPRLVVFGDATFISNAYMSDRRGGTQFYDYFVSTLGWLREKPASIGIEPKKADVFVVNPGMNFTRMILLPALIGFLGIFGLGAGVWIVRRR